MKQEPKLAAYNVDWFDSTSTKNKCLKHISDKNLPVTQEGQLTFLLDKTKHSRSRRRLRMQLARLAQPQEKLSSHYLIVKISSFVVFLIWFTMESPSWLIIPKIPSGKSICHWILKWKPPLLKLFLVNIFQTGIVCFLIECFHGDVVSLIVLHCSQTIYSRS